MKKEDIHDELKGLSPLLEQLKKKGDGMTTPPDYFNTLNEKVMQRLATEGEGLVGRPQPFWSVAVNRTKMAAAAAAAVVLLLTAWWYMKPAEQIQVAAVIPEMMANDTITRDEAEIYIQENILSFDTEMLAAEFEAEDLSEILSPNPNNPAVSKTKPDAEDLDAVLEELTEEELEDLL